MRTTAILSFVGIVILGLIGCKKEAQIVQQSYPQDEFLAREGKIGEDKFRYRVYVPANKKSGEKMPIMLYLHGTGNRGNDNESQLNGLADIIRANRDKIAFAIVIPQCGEDEFWDAKALNKANKALDDTIDELNGDTERLYLAGFSLGGYGAWTMAAMFPNKFAAVVPMSGRILPRQQEIKYLTPEIAELANSSEPYKRFAERIGNVSIWIFHGASDNVVPIDGSRRMDEALLIAGNTNVKYSEVENAGHEPLGFQNAELFTWLAQQRRIEK